jgi:hypothetical protein
LESRRQSFLYPITEELPVTQAQSGEARITARKRSHFHILADCTGNKSDTENATNLSPALLLLRLGYRSAPLLRSDVGYRL